MLDLYYKIKYKLSHTKPCRGSALCESSAGSWQGFVFISKKTFTMKKILMGLVLGSVLVPSLAFASFDVNLKYGSKGDAVRELQDFLIEQGNMVGSSTGNFYSVTLGAVKAFQMANNLPSTGFFGPMSRNRANQLLALSDSAEQAETGTVAPPVVQVPNVSDTLTQQQLANLNAQVNALNLQLQQQTVYQQQIVNNTTPPPVVPPVVPEIPLSFLSGPTTGLVASEGTDNKNITCLNCIKIVTNKPSRVSVTVDGNTITSEGYYKEHLFKYWTDSIIETVGSSLPAGVSLSELNLDKTQDHTWDVSQMTATDSTGASVTGYAGWTTLTLKKFCHDYFTYSSNNQTDIQCNN